MGFPQPDNGAFAPYQVRTPGGVLVFEIDSTGKIILSPTGATALETTVAGEAEPEFVLAVDGRQEVGDGTAAPDTDYYRVSASVLGMNDELRFERSSAGNKGPSCRIAGDTNDRSRMLADGTITVANGAGTNLCGIDAQGPRWYAASLTANAGTAGAAAGLPLLPKLYLEATDDTGAVVVIPCYNP